MSVRFTSKLERVRRPDGTREPVPGGSPATGLGALATAQTSPITGAALAAVRGTHIAPYVAASVAFESTAALLRRSGDPAFAHVDLVGTAWRTRAGSAPAPNLGHRTNAGWWLFQADRSRADTGAQAAPDDDGDGGYEVGAPMVLYPASGVLGRAVPNPEASLTGAAWTATGGAYSRASGGALPALGLPGENAHRVTSLPAVVASLASPWTPVRYRVSPGRAFTAAAWVTSNVTTDSYRVRVELRTAAGVVLSMPSAATAVSGPTRVVGTVAVPAGHAAVVPGVVFTAARVVVERITATLAPNRPSSVRFDVRGAHLYAGGDRGDTAGLTAVPIATELAFDVHVPAGQRFRVSRVDVHGSDTLGHPTAVTVDRAGEVVHAESAGRVTARFSAGVVNTGTGREVRVYVEEASVGPGGDVYVQAVELLNEVDVTKRVVGVTVDRSADADPADSTVPIGNYAATTCTITLDNTDRELSPFRAAYIDLGHRLEVAAGVVYTNRHDDPHGERGTGWVGALSDVVVDSQGSKPPGAVRMLRTPPTGEAAVQGPGAAGWRVRVGVWALGAPVAAALRVGYRAAAGVVALNPITVPAGAPWRWYETTGTLPDDATMTAVSADPGVCLASPRIERLEPATGDVVEVVETTPLGVFTTTEWQTSTDEDTVTVPAVDVLGANADAPMPWAVIPGQTVGQTLAQVFRTHLDRGADQVVIDPGTPVLPWFLPAETVGTTIADLAKAAALTAHTDGAGRPTATLRQNVDPNIAAEYRHDTALVRAAVPFTPALIRNDVTVTGTALVRTPPGWLLATVGNPEATVFDPERLWEPNGQEVTVPRGRTVDVMVTWEVAAVLSARAGGVRAYDAFIGNGPVDASAHLTVSVEVTRTFGVVHLTALSTAPPDGIIVDHLRIVGDALVEEEMERRVTRASSVAKYGRHPIDVHVRHAATPGQLTAIGDDVLNNYSLRDDTGERWLPDLEVTTLGDPWRELGDRVVAYEPRSGLGGEFRVVSHVLDYSTSAESRLYLRRVKTGLVFFVADRSRADGGHVLTY